MRFDIMRPTDCSKKIIYTYLGRPVNSKYIPVYKYAA